jgi:hypothetical protein
MKFDNEARAAVQEAAPGIATIRWPSIEIEPEKGRVYRMQSLEAARKRARERKRLREEHPATHAEVMAQMHKRYYGELPEDYKPPRRKPVRRSGDSDPFIRVLSITILQRGWEVSVALFEDPDPKRHSGIKAKVPAGPHPIFGHNEKAETEQEQIVKAPSRAEREDEEESLRVECIASADRAELARLGRKLTNERRKGKSGKQTKMALERARKRVGLLSAATTA